MFFSRIKHTLVMSMLSVPLLLQPPLTQAAEAPTAVSHNATDIDWSAYAGKVVYIDFWASWCGPCKASFPWMKAMQQKYAKDGLVIIAINVDQEPDKAAAFLQQQQPNFIIKYDTKGTVATQLGVKTMPSSFILNRQGQPADKHQGFSPSKVNSYESDLVKLLSKP